MILSIPIKDYCIGCRMKSVRPQFKPRQDDFNYLYFSINDVVYFEWSKEFEQALLWEALQRD